MNDESEMKRWGLPTIAFLLLILLWQVLSVAYAETLLFILPPPSKILMQIFLRSDRFWLHTAATLKEMLGGFFIAFSIAFPIAWIMQLHAATRSILQPLIIIIQSIPMFALAPIMVLWFGWSYTAIVIPTALMIFFPLTLNIYQGFKATPEALIDYFKVNQATQWQLFYKLYLPYALPHIFGGVRISAAIAGMGAVAGEWAGAQQGLGMLMLESRRGADLETTFGALTCLTAMSLALYALVTASERLFEPKVRRQMKTWYKYAAGRLKFAVPLLFLATSTLSCQKKEEPQNKTRLMLDWLPNPNHVPIYVGVEKGFFKDNGVDLEVVKVYDPSDVIPYLTSRQVDIGLSYMQTTLESLARGAHIKFLGVLIEEPLNSFIFRKGTMHQPKDLNHAVIGSCGSSFGMRFLNALYRTSDIHPKSTLTLKFDLAAALASKRVDAIYGAYWNIESEQLKSLGVETGYFNLPMFNVPPYYELIFLAAEGSKEAQPSFAKTLQKGLQESIEYCRQNPEEAFQIYQKHNPDRSQTTQAWERNAWLKTVDLLPHTQETDPKVWENFYNWLLENDVIDKPFNWQNIFP